MIKTYSLLNRISFRVLLATALLVTVHSVEASGHHRGKKKDAAKHFKKETKALSLLKNRPVEFLENKGQMKDMNQQPAPYLLFKAEAPGLDLYITEKGLSYVFLKIETDEEESEPMTGKGQEEKLKVSYERIDMDLAGASIKRENIVKEEESEAYCNFLMGPGNTIPHVKKYRRITIKNVYPGIDWVLYNSTASGFKYDFIVHPGASYAQVQLLYRSRKELDIDTNGNISIKTFNGSLQENAPYSYFKDSEKKTGSSFQQLSRQKKKGFYETLIGFRLDMLNAGPADYPLVIDPQLVWATFFGGTNIDGTTALDTDTLGNIYMTGYGGSTDFPLLNIGSYFQSTPGSSFIFKFSDAGVLLWSTYYAATGTTGVFIKCDNIGNVFLCGQSSTLNPFPSVNNSTYFQATNAGVNDAFIAKFDNQGNCVWATMYGGNNQDLGSSLATDQAGNVFMVGTTASTNFPVQNAGTYFDATNPANNSSSYIVKFDNNGNRLWATHLKGLSASGVCTDRFGSVYVVGISSSGILPLLNPGGSAYYQTTATSQDATILKFSNSGVLRWGTYYGGSSQDFIYSLVADRQGNVFMLGQTSSTNLPVQNSGGYYQSSPAGLSDAFLLKFDSVGVRQWGTYLGGSRGDFITNTDGVAIDTCGNLHVGFHTRSHNIPLMAACEGGFNDASLDTSVSLNNFDVYTARFSNSGAMQWATYLGGDGPDFRASLAVNRYGNYFITGEWISPTVPASYPLVNPGGSTYFSQPFAVDDIYIAKFSIPATPAQSFSYSAYCISDTNHLPAKMPGFLSGGTFTAANGLGINPLTGQVSPSTSVPGTYTVSYLMAPCHCPNAQAQVKGTATVVISAVPVLTVSGNFTICTGKPASFVASGASTYSWNVGGTSPTISLTAPTVTTVLNYTVTGYGPGGNCSAKKTFSVLVSKCTGVEELTMNGNRLQIYPNPNRGEFTISSTADVYFQLVNELGQVLRVIELSAKNDRQLLVKDLPAGIYFLRDKSGSVSEKHKILVSD